MSLPKNADIDKYKFLDMELDVINMDFFSHPSSGTGRNVIVFGIDMSSSKQRLITGKQIL